jgi:hypothetical protein
MTTKLVEDLFLADDLEAFLGDGIVEWVRELPTEEVDHYRAGLLRWLQCLRDPDDHSWIDEDDLP